MKICHMGAMLVSASILPLAASAHHSFAAHFLMDTFVEAEGRVTEVQWTNPHAFIRIEDANGDAWEFELGPVNLLTRLGIEREMIPIGETIRARGNPGRRDSQILWTENILLAGTTELVVGPRAQPYWTGNAVGDASAFFAETAAGAAESRSFFRIWTPPLTSFPRPAEDPPLTERGIEAAAAYGIDNQAIGDCEEVGMPFAMMSPYPIEFVDRGDRVLMRSEYNDLERVIHKRPLPTQPAPAPLGYSLVRFDGDDMIVETYSIDFHSYGDQGPAQSNQSHVTERFTLSADGSELTYEVSVEDPVMLSRPWRWAGRYVYRDDAELKPWNCGEEN